MQKFLEMLDGADVVQVSDINGTEIMRGDVADIEVVESMLYIWGIDNDDFVKIHINDAVKVDANKWKFPQDQYILELQ